MKDKQFLATDTALPSLLLFAFAVATDDLMIFSDRGENHTTGAAEKVEEAMLRHGIIKNPEKDVNDALSTTCVGVDLVDGRFWAAPGVVLESP